ncbi:MAG: HNH endonuclease [Tepidisphaeraceae bacterium]|jgi:hypothetical protein
MFSDSVDLPGYPMGNDIIPYIEMCRRESQSLQRGMNFQVGGTHSVILMSVRPGAPYDDELDSTGTTLIYEGHDVNRTHITRDPKRLDQPMYFPSGRLTQNGLFFEAATEYKKGNRLPERVRVYEKIKGGIWSYNGMFHLVDAWLNKSASRQVFKFKLVAVEGEEDLSRPIPKEVVVRRIIPTAVKLEVWKRDEGRCVTCGATTDLHFDHIIPWSRGGSSSDVANIQLLCGRHNLEKSNHIQ